MLATSTESAAFDPWVIVGPPPASTKRPWRSVLVGVAAWLLGCGATVAVGWSQGGVGHRGAVAIAAFGLGFSAMALLWGRLAPWWRGALWVGWLGVAMVVSHPLLGARPMVITAVGVVTAAVAFGAVRPWTSQDVELGPIVSLSLPFVVLAGAFWRETGEVVGAVLIYGSALAVVELAARRPATLGRIDHAIANGVVRVVVAVASGFLFLVTLPLLYLPGVAGAAADRISARSRSKQGSNWTPRSATLRDYRQDGSRPFASVDAGSRRRQLMLGGVIAVIALGSLVLVKRAQPPQVTKDNVGSSTRTAGVADAMELPYSERAAGEGQPWIDEVLKEQHSEIQLPPSPVAGYVLGDMETRYTNVRDGERVTEAPKSCAACPSMRIWFVGGSAAFGVGQRDQHTIPSDLVRLAATDGIELHVENMGVPGRTLWQEYQGIIAKLASDAPRPDLIIFYDGFNDMAQSYIQTIDNGPNWDDPVVFDGAALEELGGYSSDEIAERMASVGGSDDYAEQAAGRFVALRTLVSSMLDGQGLDHEFFFQPDALATIMETGQPIPSYMFPTVDRALLEPMTASLERASQASLNPAHNLRHLYDDVDGAVFFDMAHTNERGASLAAEALYRQLRPAIISGSAPPG